MSNVTGASRHLILGRMVGMLLIPLAIILLPGILAAKAIAAAQRTIIISGYMEIVLRKRLGWRRFPFIVSVHLKHPEYIKRYVHPHDWACLHETKILHMPYAIFYHELIPRIGREAAEDATRELIMRHGDGALRSQYKKSRRQRTLDSIENDFSRGHRTSSQRYAPWTIIRQQSRLFVSHTFCPYKDGMLALGLPIRLVQAKCETDDRFCEIAHLPQITYRRERGPTDTIAWGGDRCTFIWEEISAQERQQATAPKKTDTKASGEAKPQDKYLTVNNLRLHYVDWNNYGWQTMLILHDIMDESHSWDPFASHFEQTHHVVALDQRGRGDSEWSPENAYGFDDCVEDIAQVFDALKPGPMILVGHSIGGVVAMKYTMLHPETVSHLVIIDMPPSAPKRMMRSIRQMMSEFREEYESMDEITAAYRPAPPHWTEEMLSQLVQHRVRVKPDGRLEMKFDHKGIVSADAKGVGLFSWDLWKSLGMIKCPTLIVSSGRGPSFLSSRVAHKFRKSLANGIVIHMKHVSHTAHIEDAPALAHVVSEFLIDSKDKSQ